MATTAKGKPAAAKAAGKTVAGLTAYNVKTKEKGVLIQDAVIEKTARGGYIAKGHDGAGSKLTSILSEANALKFIKAGAKKGF